MSDDGYCTSDELRTAEYTRPMLDQLDREEEEVDETPGCAHCIGMFGHEAMEPNRPSGDQT